MNAVDRLALPAFAYVLFFLWLFSPNEKWTAYCDSSPCGSFPFLAREIFVPVPRDGAWHIVDVSYANRGLRGTLMAKFRIAPGREVKVDWFERQVEIPHSAWSSPRYLFRPRASIVVRNRPPLEIGFTSKHPLLAYQ